MRSIASCETAVPILKGMRILVVEDRAELRDLFAMLLTSDGADVTEAGTGREALDRACVQRFDAVLCDLGLPDVSGEIVIRYLRADAHVRPVVAVITGHGEPYIGRATAAGAQAVFRKPVEWSHVVAFLRRLKLRQSDATCIPA